MSTLGIMGKSSESLFLMLDELKFDKTVQKHIIRKTMNIAIRCSYYVFCRRNKVWNNPDLLDFWFFCINLFRLLFFFFFLFCVAVVDYIILYW